MVDISIIVPVYNAAPYLKECIESVEKQTIQSKELICIDDGSSDDSWRILESYANKYPWCRIYHQENRGPGPTRNKGIAKAVGRYISFLDADDWYLDGNALEDMICKADRYNVKACAAMRQIYRDGEFEKFEAFRDMVACDEECRIISFSNYQDDYHYQNYIFDREMILENNVRFPDLRRYQDPPFLFNALLAAGDVCFCNKELYCLRFGHQDFSVVGKNIDGVISGMLDEMVLAKKSGFEKLQRRIIHRLNSEFYCFIRENFALSLGYKLEEIEKNKIIDEKIKILEEIENFFNDRECEWIFNQYIHLKQYGWNVADELINDGVKRITIYGLGNYGEIFYNDIKGSGVDVVKCVDKIKRGVWHEKEILNTFKEDVLCDAVVVTMMLDEKTIKELESHNAMKILSFRKMIDSAYKKMILEKNMLPNSSRG